MFLFVPQIFFVSEYTSGETGVSFPLRSIQRNAWSRTTPRERGWTIKSLADLVDICFRPLRFCRVSGKGRERREKGEEEGGELLIDPETKEKRK